MPKLDGVKLEPGFITVSGNSGPPVKYSLSDLLRAADIPVGLTHAQVAGIGLLANVIVVLIRTLIAKDVLDEAFIDSLGMEWDLDHLIYVLEQLGGSFTDPDFTNVDES